MNDSRILCAVLLILMCGLSQTVCSENTNGPGNQIKINLFPMLGGRLYLSWEKAIREKQSIDIGLEIIGILRKETQPSGFLANLGYKFYMPGTGEDKNIPMAGFYLSPRFMAGMTSYKEILTIPGTTSGPQTVTEFVTGTHFIFGLELGRQFILHNKFSIDFSAGAGLYLSDLQQNNKADYSPTVTPWRFGFYCPGGQMPLAITACIRLGYVR